MGGLRGRGRHRMRVAARAAAATLVIGTGLFGGGFPQLADATLPGSVFNGADASPVGDLAAGAIMLPDPVGNIDVTNYTGSDENDPCPQLAVGTASPKDDLDAFYVGSQSNASGVFMYLGWRRVALTGSTTIDFEVNRSPGPAPNCNGVNPARTDGDVLFTYDFQGSGPYTLDISKRMWDAANGEWGAEQALPPSTYEASISANGAYGEMVVNLTGSGLLATVGCDSFTSVFPKSRSSSNSFTAAIKEYVAPHRITATNCGSVGVHKQDDAAAPLAGVTFQLAVDAGDSPGAPVSPAQGCTTDAAGDCTIAEVLPGTYWVVEQAPPAGHTGAAAQKVTVGRAANVPAGTLTFVNGRKPARVDVVKKDDAGALLAGAGFTLHTDDAGQVGAAVSGKACTTGVDGTCSIGGILPPGTYWVVETTTPSGHASAAAQKTTVALDQTVTLTFVNNRLPAAVNVVKTDDAGAAMADVAFGLYADDNNSRGAAVPGKACTTGADGTCSITGILPAGTYWVHEESAPAGHTAAADQKVVLGLNQTVTVEFVNTRRPAQVDIVKKDDAGALLAGAGFTLHSDNGGQVGSAVSGKTCVTGLAGTCSIGGILPAGAYWVVETTTPAGHNGAAPQQATLALSQTVEVTFVNVRKPIGISLSKTANGEQRTEADPLYTHAGDEVTYELLVKNTGDLPLTVTALTDSLNADVADSCDLPADDVLAVGGSFTCEYSSNPDDDEHNVASVTGTDVLGRTATSSDEAFVVPITPAIAVDKSADVTEVSVSATVVYSYAVTNTGDTALFDVSVDDDVLGHIGDIAQLDPGRSQTMTASMVVQAGSPPTNVVVVKGTDRLGKTVSARDSQTITVVLGETVVRPHIVELPRAPLRSAPELPRTGAEVGGWLRLALALVVAGALLLGSAASAGRARGRPAQSTSD